LPPVRRRLRRLGRRCQPHLVRVVRAGLPGRGRAGRDGGRAQPQRRPPRQPAPPNPVASLGWDGWFHELRGAGLVWGTPDATIVLGQDIIQPALRTLPTSNAPHPAPSIHVPHGINHPMYILIVGGGKVGSNLTSTLMKMGHEVTLVEGDRDRYALLEEKFEHVVRPGDATELFVLERAGVERADLVVAVTGDDEDNIIVCQVAKEKYGVPKVIARVNDPRNQPHFDMVGITLTVSATATILALIEHQLPQHELVTLIDLKRENLEIVEFAIGSGSPAAGKYVRELNLPNRSRLISVTRDGRAEIAIGETQLAPGDLVMAILEPDVEDELKQQLMPA